MKINHKTAPKIAAYANQVLDRIATLKNPYFMALQQFRKTQEQLHFAASFFSRLVSALVGRIPHAKDRLDILHNVLEEHGDLNEDNFHATTFQRFLKSIESETAEFEKVIVSPQIRAFNSVLTASCTYDELELVWELSNAHLLIFQHL